MNVLHFFRCLFIFSFIFVSCSKDDSSESGTEADTSKIDNQQPLGSSANDLLSSSIFKDLKIEIISAKGFEPTNIAVNNLKSFLQDRLFKSRITIAQRSVASSGKAPFTIEEIVEIEKNNRTLYNNNDEITVFVYFADGSKQGDTDKEVTLGSAYLNTSMVIYEETIKGLSNRLNSPSLSTIETAALLHEFCHLLGLVNVGTPLQSDHEDSEAHNHCAVSGCLMNANIQFGSTALGNIDTIPTLDPQCIADLQAHGGR